MKTSLFHPRAPAHPAGPGPEAVSLAVLARRRELQEVARGDSFSQRFLARVCVEEFVSGNFSIAEAPARWSSERDGQFSERKPPGAVGQKS